MSVARLTPADRLDDRNIHTEHGSPVGPGGTAAPDEPDSSTADVFAIAAAVSAGAGRRIVLDLDRVSEMAVPGLAVVVNAHERARQRGAAVILVVDQDTPAARALRLLPVELVPPIYPTLTDALAVPA